MDFEKGYEKSEANWWCSWWFILVFSITTMVVLIDLWPVTHIGNTSNKYQTLFTVHSGWFMDVDDPLSNFISIDATSNHPFEIMQKGGKSLKGISEPPPLNWQYDTYYHFKGQLSNGRWLIKGGPINIKTYSEETFTVTKSPIFWKAISSIVLGVCIALLIWISPLAILILLDLRALSKPEFNE